jgi:hypothetical protein
MRQVRSTTYGQDLQLKYAVLVRLSPYGACGSADNMFEFPFYVHSKVDEDEPEKPEEPKEGWSP